MRRQRLTEAKVHGQTPGKNKPEGPDFDPGCLCGPPGLPASVSARMSPLLLSPNRLPGHKQPGGLEVKRQHSKPRTFYDVEVLCYGKAV